MRTDYERAIEELKHYESQYPMYFYDACVLDEETVTLAISALSRSRIRETATEPPTEEDGGKGNHAPYVMARENKHDFWEEIELEWVANHPDEYPHWTCVPQLQEVE